MQDQLHLIRKRKRKRMVANIILLCGIALLVGIFAKPHAIMQTVVGALLLQYFPKEAYIIAHFGSLGIALATIFIGALLHANS